MIIVKLVNNDQPWYPKIVAVVDRWPLLTGGRCSQVNYIVKVQYGASKWWYLLTDGRYDRWQLFGGGR